jgi:ferric-dicitrate binding protein FerR (iron transport regulator)
MKMDDDIDPQPADSEDGSEDVARLLRLAGRRPRLPESEAAPLRAEAREVFRRQARKTVVKRRAGWTAVGSGLAAAVLLLVLGLFWQRDPSTRLPIAQIEKQTGEVTLSDAALLPGTVVTTADSGRVAVRLPAGASVRIDGNSTVRFDSGRTLTLERGALYADAGSSRMSAGTHEGIEIATAFGSVRDVGTQFEVRLLPEGLRVRVREGKVRVEHGRLLEAEAGSELLVHADGSSQSADVPVYGPGWDWVQRTAPPFTIENASLAEFLRWVSRETGLRWHLAEPDDDPETVILHGSIEGLTAEEALSVVLPGCGYRHRLVGGEIRLEKAVLP